MSITATLFIQMISFVIFIWFTLRFVWRPLTGVMDRRNKRIADGLAAAERGQRTQELAEQRVKESLHEAKGRAAEIIANAQKRATELVEEAKRDARAEGERLIAAARAEIEQEIHRAREELRQQVSVLAVRGAERVLKREVDLDAHRAMLDELVTQL